MFSLFGGIDIVKLDYLLHHNLLIFYYRLGVDNFIICLLFLQQYLLLFSLITIAI